MYVRYASLLGSLILLTGCAGLFGPTASMSAEQIKELAKIKDASITCIIANTPYGKGSALFLSLDKGVMVEGTIQITDSCQTTITSGPKKP